MVKNGPNYNKSFQPKIPEPAPYSSHRDTHHPYSSTKPMEAFQDMTEPICIIGDKVYSFCQQRDCFPMFKIDIMDKGIPIQFVDICFQAGHIADGTLCVTPIGIRRPNFSRIKFTLQIPFTMSFRNRVSGETLSTNGFLPNIHKDLVLYLPEARNEFDYRIVVETRSEILAPPEISDGKMEVPIGVFSIVRVVGRVQLMIPTYSFVPDPPEGEKFQELEEHMCHEFDSRPFPNDFFPPQFEDIETTKKQ